MESYCVISKASVYFMTSIHRLPTNKMHWFHSCWQSCQLATLHYSNECKLLLLVQLCNWRCCCSFNFSPWTVSNDDKPLYVLYMFKEIFSPMRFVEKNYSERYWEFSYGEFLPESRSHEMTQPNLIRYCLIFRVTC